MFRRVCSLACIYATLSALKSRERGRERERESRSLTLIIVHFTFVSPCNQPGVMWVLENCILTLRTNDTSLIVLQAQFEIVISSSHRFASLFSLSLSLALSISHERSCFYLCVSLSLSSISGWNTTGVTRGHMHVGKYYPDTPVKIYIYISVCTPNAILNMSGMNPSTHTQR